MGKGIQYNGAARLLFAGLVAMLGGCGGKGQPAALVAKTGETTVTILNATVKRLKLAETIGQSEEAAETAESVLQIKIRVGNSSAARKLDFRRWGWYGNYRGETIFKEPAAAGDSLIAEDEIGNRYGQLAVVNFAGSWRGGLLSIPPGGSLDEWIIFQAPVPQAKALTIKLDAANLGQSGTLTLRLPAAEIVRE